MLVGAGADVAARDTQGRQPLHLASMEGHEAVAVALLEAGAEVAVKDVNLKPFSTQNPQTC